MTKQARILAAVDAGAETTREVEAETGLPYRLVASTLCNLHRAGLLERVGRFRYPDAVKPCWRYRARPWPGEVEPPGGP